MAIHTKRFFSSTFKSVAVGGRQWPSVAVGGRRWPSVSFTVWWELGLTHNLLSASSTASATITTSPSPRLLPSTSAPGCIHKIVYTISIHRKALRISMLSREIGNTSSLDQSRNSKIFGIYSLSALLEDEDLLCNYWPSMSCIAVIHFLQMLYILRHTTIG